MKKTLFILLVIVITLLYYLGFLTKEETLPLSKEFFAAESSASMNQVFDLKGGGLFQFTRKELDQIYQLQLDKGIRNFSNLSIGLIREAQKARKAGDLDRATEQVSYANKISPDLPQPYFELARTRFLQKPFSINGYLPEIFKGYQAQLNHFSTSLHFFYQLFYIISNAILMSFILFGIVTLVKNVSLYFYGIRKNITQEVSSLLLNGLKIFLLFVPLFLRLDILWSILFWAILMWGYVPKKERQFVVVFLIILVYFPFFLRATSTLLNGQASDVILEMHEANHENWDKGTEEKLRAWSLTHPNDPEVLFTLGLIEKRQGRYSQAEEFYRRAIQFDPQSSETFSNLGNVYLAQKQVTMAVASYQQAIELNPNKGAYYYNLYRAYSQETFLSAKAGPAFQKARQRNPDLIDYYNSIDSPNMNRLVIDEVLTSRMIWERLLTQLIGREGLLFRLFKAWFERVPSALPFLAPILFLAFLIGMSRYTRTRRFVTRCPMCGSATHRFYLSALEALDQEFVCFNCYRLFVQKEKLHPKISEKKSRQAEQFQKQSHMTGRFLSYFFVGFYDLWRGSSFKGLLLLFVFFIFILRLVFWNGVLPGALIQTHVSWWGAFFWGGLFILFYLLSIRRVRRQKPEYEIQK